MESAPKQLLLHKDAPGLSLESSICGSANNAVSLAGSPHQVEGGNEVRCGLLTLEDVNNSSSSIVRHRQRGRRWGGGGEMPTGDQYAELK